MGILMATERSWEPSSGAGLLVLTSKCSQDNLALMMRYKLTTGRHFSQRLEQGLGLGLTRTMGMVGQAYM